MKAWIWRIVDFLVIAAFILAVVLFTVWNIGCSPTEPTWAAVDVEAAVARAQAEIDVESPAEPREPLDEPVAVCLCIDCDCGEACACLVGGECACGVKAEAEVVDEQIPPPAPEEIGGQLPVAPEVPPRRIIYVYQQPAKYGRCVPCEKFETWYHSDAADATAFRADYQLIFAESDWEAIRGYPELHWQCPDGAWSWLRTAGWPGVEAFERAYAESLRLHPPKIVGEPRTYADDEPLFGAVATAPETFGELYDLFAAAASHEGLTLGPATLRTAGEIRCVVFTRHDRTFGLRFERPLPQATVRKVFGLLPFTRGISSIECRTATGEIVAIDDTGAEHRLSSPALGDAP